MIPASFYVCVALIAGVLGLQLRAAVVAKEPVLAVIVLTFGVYFVYGGLTEQQLLQDFQVYFGVDAPSVGWSGVLALVTVLAVWAGYRVPQRFTPRRRHIWPIPSENAILLLSVVGLSAHVVLFALRGGISYVWARSATPEGLDPTGRGTLTTIADLSLLYPLYVYWAWPVMSPRRRSIAIAIGIAYSLAAAVSGTASSHVVNAVGFALIWLRRRRPSVARILAMLVLGIAMVTILRYLRYVGGMSPDDRDWVKAFTDFFAADNTLNLRHSISTFFMFGKAIEITEWTGLQWGSSYLASLTAFVPAYFYPDKYEFYWQACADRFVPRFYGETGQLWPPGFYGEAYLNFGFFGLVAVSLLFGWLARRAELWLRRSEPILGLPSWLHACYLAGALSGAVRINSSGLVFAYALRLEVLLLLLAPIMIVGFWAGRVAPRPRRARFSEHPGLRGFRPRPLGSEGMR